MTAEYVTDTHSLLWHLYLPKRVGRAAREAFADADAGTARIHVPAVVIAESLMVIQKGRLPGVTLSQLLPQIEAMRERDNYLLSPSCPRRYCRAFLWLRFRSPETDRRRARDDELRAELKEDSVPRIR